MGGQLGRLFGGKTEEEIADTLARISDKEVIVIFKQLSVTDLLTRVPRFGRRYYELSKRDEIWNPRYYALKKKEYTDKNIEEPEYDEDFYRRSRTPFYDRFIDLWIDRPHIWRNSETGRITGAASWYRDEFGFVRAFPMYWIELDKGRIKIIQSRKIEADCPDIYIRVPGMLNSMFNLDEPGSTTVVPYDANRVDIDCVNNAFNVEADRYRVIASLHTVVGLAGALAQYLVSYQQRSAMLEYFTNYAPYDDQNAWEFINTLGSADPFPLLETVSAQASNFNPFVPTVFAASLIGASVAFALAHKAVWKYFIARGVNLSHIDNFVTTPHLPPWTLCLPVYIMFTDAENSPENTKFVELNRFEVRQVFEKPFFEHSERSFLGSCMTCGISSQLLYRCEATNNIYCSSECQNRK